MRILPLITLIGCGFRGPAVGSNDSGSSAGIDGEPSATCSDGIMDGDETGVDCGGACGACSSCTQHTLPPSINVDATQWTANFLTSPVWSCNASGTTTIDSAVGTVTSTSCALGTLDVTNDVPQLDASASHVLVVRLRGLTVSNGHVFKLTGDKPIVFLVAGSVVVDSGGLIDAGAKGGMPGPGGSSPGLCTDHASGLGELASDGTWGGGGGGFGTAGGQGGWNLTNGGLQSGNSTLVPLRGGCSGSTPATTPSGQVGGGGGGAVEISASGTIAIGPTAPSSVVAGGGGAPGYSMGGNGGGSGGGILLVASALPMFGPSGAACANGGAGSQGGTSSNLSGQDGHAGDTNPATDTSGMAGGGNTNDHGRTGGMTYQLGAQLVTTPGNMTGAQNGGRGGGGGGGGRIQITTGTTSTSCD